MLSQFFYYLKFIFYIIINLPRDLKGAVLYQKIKRKLKYYDKKSSPVHDVFSRWVNIQPDKVLFRFNDENMTFKQVCLFNTIFLH